MKIYNYLIYLAISFIIVACNSTRLPQSSNSNDKEEFKDSYYYKIFTDATKHALFGNYKSAIGLYNSCIKQFPERGAPYYQLSSIYLRSKEIVKARENAINAVKYDSTNIWYILQLANIYQYEEKYDSAAILYENALNLKNDPELKYNLAILYSRSGNNKSALKILDELDGLNEGSKEILLLKHNIYHSVKEYDSAIVTLELLTRYFPDDPSIFGILAEYLTEIGRNNYAKKVYEGILRKDSINGLVMLSFAEFYALNNNLDSAFIYYSKAFCCSDLSYENKIGVGVNFIVKTEFIEENKDMVLRLLDTIPREEIDFRLYASYADIFINLDEYDNAIPYIDSALIYEKNNYMLWEQALLMNNYRGNYESVVNIADQCYEYFPDEPNIFFISALAQNALNINNEALRDLDSVDIKNPPVELKIQSMNLRAEIYRGIEEYSTSDSIYEEILKIDPENLMIRNNYSYYLSIRNENLERAKELSELTIIKEPDNSTYLDTYGWILYMAGDLKNAKKYIERSIRNGAYNNPEVLDHYGQIMFDMQNCMEALEAWRKIKEIDEDYNIDQKIKKAEDQCK